MAGHPLDLHASRPVKLQERLAAERRGVPFLVYRDADGRQVIVLLDERGQRLTIAHRAPVPSLNETPTAIASRRKEKPRGA
jgi:hypothetical protein